MNLVRIITQGELWMRFDLHIHSFASKYKESNDIVDKSTIDNVDVLLHKLQEYEVGLFSITDHNRFDVELYEKLDSIIQTKAYSNVEGLLAGVEFDVQIDDEMGKCHIITIFDAKNSSDNYRRIEAGIRTDLLKSKDEYYTKERFEKILRAIGLDVILIACQRNSLDKQDGRHNSLSEASKEPIDLIKTGYINALEFQRPNVEGILKNNLKDIPVNIGLVMGSDCHEWNVYPKHDHKNGNKNFIHSRAKILPTFKGLLMAVTSPETRINQQANSNVNYIKEFFIGEQRIPLVNGINAIIGENGSGKSTLLKLLNDKVSSPAYIKALVNENKLTCNHSDSFCKLFIGQGEIIKKFDSKTLFPKDNFNIVDHTKFRDLYESYAKDIFNYIKENIERKLEINNLKQESLIYNVLNNNPTYFLEIQCDEDFVDIENIHEKHKNDISDIVDKLQSLLNDIYFDKFKKEIDSALSLLVPIRDEIKKVFDKIEVEKNLRNIISSEIFEYSRKIREASSSQDRDLIAFRKKRNKFIKSIIDVVCKDISENEFPKPPKKIKGDSKKPSCGFNFNSESNYHEKDVHDDFMRAMFNQCCLTIEKLKSIDEWNSLIAAIRGCTSYEKIEEKYQENLNKFFDQMCECQNYIVDISNGEMQLGSTLGEQSLAYFKYISEFETNKSIFLIDQPEDHISNNNISKKLIKYFNSIRDQKQIIIVTHNPLLVVNLDVEQIIFVEKNNNMIELKAGCLEFENTQVNMLELVADNMDGGKVAIEKRLKVYG